MPPRDYFLGATSEQFLGLLGELQNASDRVTAIAAAAFLDDTLGAALLSRFVNVGSTWKDRLFSAPNAPFGSFYSKAIAGYALGLFGPQTYADLDLIRKVRNEFAHTATPLRFADEAMAAMCNRLTTPSRTKMGLGTLFFSEPGPKAQYARAIYGIAIALSGQISASKSSRPTHPFSVLP